MTNEDIEQFIELADKTTLGPWHHELERYAAKNVIGNKPLDDRWIAHCQPEFNGYYNAEFIAASRTIAPDLAKEVLRLREHNQQLLMDYENVRLERDFPIAKENRMLRDKLILAAEALERISVNCVPGSHDQNMAKAALEKLGEHEG